MEMGAGVGYIGCRSTKAFPEAALPMPIETVEFLLLLSGWIVAFLLGRELQTGYRLWRVRVTEERSTRRNS